MPTNDDLGNMTFQEGLDYLRRLDIDAETERQRVLTIFCQALDRNTRAKKVLKGMQRGNSNRPR